MHTTLVVAATTLCCLALQTAAVAAPRIVIRTPHAWQVVQRGAAGSADLGVTGRMIGVAGSVRVAWGKARVTVRCDSVGRFSARLEDLGHGEQTLRVWSARRPDVAAERDHVAVGDVYVIAGQSNASGRSPFLSSYSSPDLHASMFGNDDRWRDLTDPVDSAEGQIDRINRDLRAGGSVWPQVATVLLAEEGVPVAFVPCARSSTTIARWLPGVQSRQPAGTLYGSMARRIAAVGGRVRAVLWWQGEQDARVLAPGTRYGARLHRLAAAVRRDFHAPMVVAQIGDYGVMHTDAGVDDIRLAQARSWQVQQTVEGPVLYDIDLDGQVHFTQPDEVAVAARRWAAAILRGVLHHEVSRSPRLLTAQLRAGGKELRLTADTELAPGTSPGGLTVRVADRTLPVESARIEGVTVTLILEEAAVGTCLISLGAGRHGAGVAVPTDASAWRLPMVPFIDAPAL